MFFFSVLVALILASVQYYIIPNQNTLEVILLSIIVFILTLLAYPFIDKLYTVEALMKLQYLLYLFLGLYTSFFAIQLYNFLIPNKFISNLIIWSLLIYFSQLTLVLQFDEYPLLRRRVKVKTKFSYPAIPFWIFFNLVIGALIAFIGLIYRFETLDTILAIILHFSLSIFVLSTLNQIFWKVQGGVGEFRPPKPPKDLSNVKYPLESIDQLLELSKHRIIEPELYYDSLEYFREELLAEQDLMRKVQIVNNIISTSTYYGVKGKRGKIYVFLLLPTLLERWRVFALLPRYLQRLSHGMLEMLYLTGELTPKWNDILSHEVNHRISAKIRFAIISGSPIPPQEWKKQFLLEWEEQLYMGQEGFSKAKEKLFARGLRYSEPSTHLSISEWENDLETATISVFQTFFGYGSRGAWGKSVEKGSYYKHAFIAQGNLLKDYHENVIVKSYKPRIPMYSESVADEFFEEFEDVDEKYIEHFIQTGELPKPRRKKYPTSTRVKRYFATDRFRSVVSTYLKIISLYALLLLLGITSQEFFNLTGINSILALVGILMIFFAGARFTNASGVAANDPFRQGSVVTSSNASNQELKLSDFDTGEKIPVIILSGFYLLLLTILL